MEDDPIITINDIRLAGHCAAGARDWFVGHNLDFRAFIKEGARASTLLAVEDNGLAAQVIERKRMREDG